MTSNPTDEHLDCLVVGGGFSGVQMLYELRQRGFVTKLYDADAGFGGIWRNVRYPGARVDSELPMYAFKYPVVHQSWSWSQRYPDYKEIRRYFDHVDKILDLRRDARFCCPVRSATWNETKGVWDVVAGQQGSLRSTQARFIFFCMGFAAKINWPDIPNRETFKGTSYHSGAWPEGLEPEQLAGQKIGIIGTGASGVQITQELGKFAGHLTVFVRSPNLTLPMDNRPVTKETQDMYRDGLDAMYEARKKTFAGFLYDFDYENWSCHTPEQREAFFEAVWAKGGFQFWLANYMDVLVKKEANDCAYRFWQKKVAPMIEDQGKRDVLAPPLEKAHHTFGTARPSLRTTYYDVINKDSTQVISVKQNPIKTFTKTGVELADGTKVDVDTLVLATGYDTHTGGFLQLDIDGRKGVSLRDHWKQGCRSYLGLATAGFPNMFFTYGPHGPTAFSNGPTATDVQCEALMKLMDYVKGKGVKTIEADAEAEEAFVRRIDELSKATLFHRAHGAYMARNVKGKPAQPLNYTGGVPMYVKEIEKCAEGEYKGWEKTMW